MKQVQLLRIVVASPTDVEAERSALGCVIDELNHTTAQERGLCLELRGWETVSFPGFHPKGPQGLIDEQLKIEDCDVLVGIFWKRFGSPTMHASSGTEHEFLTAYNSWKKKGSPDIMFYFNEQPLPMPMSKSEVKQLQRVINFKENFPDKGLWGTYNGNHSFRIKVHKDLTQWLQDKYPLSPSGKGDNEQGITEASNSKLSELEPSSFTK